MGYYRDKLTNKFNIEIQKLQLVVNINITNIYVILPTNEISQI
jgi:hypothetical protein